MRISDWSSDVCSSDLAADVYSPCALGGTVNEQTLPRFKFKVICGAANNQLASNAVGDEVVKRGILYAPDYAVNARSEARRVGKEGVSPCRSRWSPYH